MAPKVQPPTDLDSNDIYAWAAKPKHKKEGFSTAELGAHFGIPHTRALAFIAVCRSRGQLKPNGKAADGTSHWFPVDSKP